MKKILAMLLLTVLVFTCAAQAETTVPEALLMMVYADMSDRTMEAAAIYADGTCRSFCGTMMEISEETLYTLESAETAGTLGSDDLFALKSLTTALEPFDTLEATQGADMAERAGVVCAYGADHDLIFVATFGDYVNENTQPEAQALYQLLCVTFPEFRMSVWNAEGIYSPAGFAPVPVSEFLGFGAADLDACTLKAAEQSSEEGPIEYAPTETEEAAIRALMRDGMVTGKHSCVMTTGGSVVYTFVDANGDRAAYIELYDGLLVMNDGMYNVE